MVCQNQCREGLFFSLHIRGKIGSVAHRPKQTQNLDYHLLGITFLHLEQMTASLGMFADLLSRQIRNLRITKLVAR